MFEVTVPATSANLGVGYDVLGLAVDLYLKVEFASRDHGVAIIGGDPKFQNTDNLIYQAFQKGCAAIGEPTPGVQMTISCDIPDSRGLGSSAACIVAGLAGANYWFDSPLNDTKLLALATAMEGHPDNVAPAIFGELTATIMTGNKPVVAHYHVADNWQLAVVIPDVELSTAKARAVLPKTMTYAKASYQMGHCTLAATALERGDEELLQAALQDQMQEPFRASLIDGFPEIKNLGQQLGLNVVISGAGSTMLAIGQKRSQLQRFLQLAKQAHPTWRCEQVHIQPHGAQISTLQAAAEA